MNDPTQPAPRSPPRASLLGNLINVQPGEGGRLILCALYFFFVLFSYYILRPVRETMGIERGFDKLAWLITGTLLAMLLVNPIYAWFVSRVPRRVFIPWTYRFFILNILVFFGFLMVNPGKPPKELAYAFYIWVSVYNLFVVSIFWSVMSDVHDAPQAKRLFAAIGIGGTLGAMGGSAATAYLTKQLAPEHSPYLLLGSAAVLEVAVWFAVAILRTAPAKAGASEPGPRPFDGLALVARSPYLRHMSIYMLLSTITATVLYVEQGRVIEAMFPSRDDRIRAFASLDFWTNSLTLLTQLFLTARVIRWLGVKGALVIVPLITLIGFGAMAWMAWSHAPIQASGDGGADAGAVARGAFVLLFAFQVARRGLHYAIDRPARETLYTITSVDEKYKSKAFIDTFVYRLGDQIGAWGTVGAHHAMSAAAVLGAIAMPVALLWIGTAFMLGRAYDARTKRAD